MTTRKPRSISTGEKTILTDFLAELSQELPTDDGNAAITKAQALVKNMIRQALEGDAKMLASVLKLMERLDTLATEPEEEDARTPKEDWEIQFAFYAKYKSLIEQEIEKRKALNPDYWGFDWFRPTLETAPWYRDLYGA